MIAILLLALQAPPDEAACLEFARRVEASIGKGDGTEADRLIDGGALLDRALKDTPGEEKNKAAFRTGVLKKFQVGPKAAEAVRKDGSYKFLRLRTEGNSRRALFRLIEGGSFNYHDFLLETGPGGALRATDVHIMLTGEWMSESFRRTYVGIVAAQPGVLGKLAGKENEYAKTVLVVQRMNQLIGQEKFAEALKVYDGLGAEGKKDKMALLTRWEAATEAAPAALVKILEEFEKAHPGDACLPMISIDAHLAAKRFDKAQASIDVVDKSVGGDPYLHVVRAGVHLEAGALDRAKGAAAKAIEGEKGLSEAYWTLVTISLREKKHADTAKWLGAIEKDLGEEVGDLAGDELYADFVKSAEYREWQKGRKK
jgi:hypothetical protein